MRTRTRGAVDGVHFAVVFIHGVGAREPDPRRCLPRSCGLPRGTAPVELGAVMPLLDYAEGSSPMEGELVAAEYGRMRPVS